MESAYTLTETPEFDIAPELVSAMTKLRIRLFDPDAKTHPTRVDYVSISVRTNAKRRGKRTRIDEFRLTETSGDSGVFVGYLQLTPDKMKFKGDLEVLPGDLVVIRHEGASGNTSAEVEVGAWDPEFAANQDAVDIGDTVVVTISDPGANRDPDIPDGISIRLFSDSDPDGLALVARETGQDTGIFRVFFKLSQEKSSRDSIQTAVGESVTVAYTSEMPADYHDRVTRRQKPQQTFFFSIPIAGKTLIELDLKRIELYFDPVIFDRIRKGSFLETSTRTITIVFWDIRGFSRLIDILRANPKDAADFLNEYLAIATNAVCTNGGILDKFVGDGVMALFGVFSDVGEVQKNAIAAVKAALDFKHKFADLVARWKKKWASVEEQSIHLELGCGINTGEAIIGNFGGLRRIQYTALGRSVNIANRLESKSKGNTILISSRTKELVKAAFEIRYVATLRNMKNIVGNYPYFEVSRVRHRQK